MIGIGINLNENITIKDRIIWPASSIKQELNRQKKIDVISVARRINKTMINNVQKLISESFTVFNEEYLNKLIFNKNEDINIKLDNETKNVKYKGVTKDGLLIYESDNKIYKMHSGEVTLI